jgi:hypothetical protein
MIPNATRFDLYSYILHRNEGFGLVCCACIVTVGHVLRLCLFTDHFSLHILVRAIN